MTKQAELFIFSTCHFVSEENDGHLLYADLLVNYQFNAMFTLFSLTFGEEGRGDCEPIHSSESSDKFFPQIFSFFCFDF